MVVTRDYMEQKILNVYNGPDMHAKLKTWSAEKIYAVYTRLLNEKKFEKEK